MKLTGTLKKIETDFILLEVSTKEKVEGEKKKKLRQGNIRLILKILKVRKLLFHLNKKISNE